VVQHLLHIVQSEATEYGQSTVQPNVLGEHQGARGCCGKNERGKPGERYDSHASQQRPAEVEILVRLGRGADEGERAHQAGRVQTSAREDGRIHEEERRQEKRLGDVEGRPESVFLDIAGRRQSRTRTLDAQHSLAGAGGHGAVHGADAAHETNTQHQPRICAHEPEAPPVHVQRARGNADHADAQARVHEGVVEVGALKGGHAAVLARLAVEDEVDAQQRGAEDAGAVQQPLAQVALGGGVVGGLLVRAAERLAEAGDMLRRGGGGRLGRGEEVRVLLQWRAVEGAEGERRRRLGRGLLERGREGERSPQEEGHGEVCEAAKCR
jgi:hypothetical protein